MDSDIFDQIAKELGHQERSIHPGFISTSLAHELREDLALHQSLGDFKRAGIGKGSEFRLQDQIRRDEIYWLNPPGKNPAQLALWERIELLQKTLNRSLFLGLREFEGHYAAYPAGGFYRRHRDVFAQDDSRMVSLVLYLNPGWQPSHGGQLRLHTENGPLDIEPREGTLALFLSRELEHEVLPSQAPRLSFTGWFKTAGPSALKTR